MSVDKIYVRDSSKHETSVSESFRKSLGRQSDRGKKSSVVISGMRVGSLLRTWAEVSKINYMSSQPLDIIASGQSLIRRRSIGLPAKEVSLQIFIPSQLRIKSDEDLFAEQFPVNVTPLMNEGQLWRCFYIFPELYADAYSPVVRIRNVDDVPELVGGVLTRDMVTTSLTYLKRTPILGDFVYIKLDLSAKHLINIEVLQHYKYLVYLDLSSNYLTELNVLSHLLYLQFLSVAFNRLTTVLEYETPQWFLTEVHYKYNSVKKIRDISMFWSITILDLSHNNIKSISGLENLRYLRRLDLSFNHIQRLENLNQLRLIWLDVSYNNISSFDFGFSSGLWTLLHLEYLNLNENNLTSMKIFSGCTRLRELHARNNRLYTLLELAVYMRQMRRLVLLDLRANPICSAPGYKDVVINTFPILLSLDAEELDPVEQQLSIINMTPDVSWFATRRLLRLLYIEQLARAQVSPDIPPADTTEVPIVIIVGYDAVGKASLARRLASECSEHIELALQHTTALYHLPGHYKEVAREKFDDMLLAGEFLTYTEMEGESYGLSRHEGFINEGKVRIATMDLTAALMLKQRGRRPYLILSSCIDKIALAKRQEDRKLARIALREKKLSLEVPFEKSTLQVLISGRILVTGILNEILMGFPGEKEKSEFVIESECSLLMDSEARHAVQEFAKGFNMITLLRSSNTSLEEACDRVYSNAVRINSSLCSLYKESQNTDEYASGVTCSFQDSKKGDKDFKTDKSLVRPKSVDFTRYVSSTWKGMSGVNSTKSSKSVTFTAQGDAATGPPDADGNPERLKDLIRSGMLIEPPKSSDLRNDTAANQLRSLSKKLPWPAASTRGAQRAGSGASLDDLDLWLAFLVETGLMRARDGYVDTSAADGSAAAKRNDTKVDDPELIIRQLEFYHTVPTETYTTNVRDDYEDIHRKCPGLFWDTVTMDDPDQAFVKVKRIIREIVNSQKNLKPMFDIDFANMDHYPTVQSRLTSVRNQIAPQRLFY